MVFISSPGLLGRSGVRPRLMGLSSPSSPAPFTAMCGGVHVTGGLPRARTRQAAALCSARRRVNVGQRRREYRTRLCPRRGAGQRWPALSGKASGGSGDEGIDFPLPLPGEVTFLPSAAAVQLQGLVVQPLKVRRSAAPDGASAGRVCWGPGLSGRAAFL